MVNKIHDIVLAVRRVKIKEIANIEISTERIQNVLHETLDMKKLSARWVPRLRGKALFGMFKRNPKEFLRRFVTVDETWIHHYTPETKEQSKQWAKSGKFAPKKAKTVPSERSWPPFF